MTEAAPAPVSKPLTAPASTRLMSIDALRGFDMFWIFGGKEVFVAVLTLLFFRHGLPGWLDYHLEHPAWQGFAAWDMIMPLFLFLSGVSIPFAFSKRMGESHDYKAIYRRMARRVALLWILGMVAQGNLLTCLISMDTAKLHLFSNTLQSIAVGYVIASVAVLHLSVLRQVMLCAGLLVAYWLLMMFVPLAGMSPGYLEPHFNVALAVDDFILGRFRDGTTYTWILPGLGFGGSVLLGAFAGHVLRRKDWTPTRRFAKLCALGAGCLAGGWLWGLFFPIIKHAWTSSMVLWAGGWSFLLLALFYLVIDIWGFRKWSFLFVVIGANAIVAYIAPHIIEVDDLLEKLPLLGSNELVVSVLGFMIFWIPLWIMYKRKIFVRV